MNPSVHRRGAAAVELAVLCLVLVPLIMYAIFLGEMFQMKLNGQEAAIQAPWDFTLVDFSNPSKKVDHNGSIARQSRRTYCDHSAAFNSYDVKYDCADHHHTSFTAHECWLTRPGQQVKCTIADTPLTGSGDLLEVVSKSFPSGGVVSCTSRLGIMNYYLPNKFLENFTTVQVTQKKRMTSRWAGRGASRGKEDAHGDAKSNTGAAEGGGAPGQGSGDSSASRNFFSLAPTDLRMMTDSWAVTHMYDGQKGIADLDQDKVERDPAAMGRAVKSPRVPSDRPEEAGEHPVYDRIAKSFWKLNAQGLQKSNDFHGSMQDFLHSDSQEDRPGIGRRPDRGNGDYMSTPSMRFEKNVNPQRGARGGFAAGWGDSRNNGQRGSDYWQAMDPQGKQ
ncbi:MAG: hypothetical protein INH41_25795 [Myxococcaceae bacterium]|nr:hypothetical protein [Myxococcaceae bacterium]MCA3015815.1 hypothetical protein [Myxococcaceae bacterium]